METYDNIVLRRIGMILFAIVLAVHIFGIGDAGAEALKAGADTRKIVTMGTFEQDNNPDNGAEAIEWIVLDEQDGKSLLISRYALDSVPYHDGKDDADWEKCSLRGWLNNEFLQSSFTPEEQAAIQTTTVVNGAGQGSAYSIDGGADTQDKLFLLSYREAFQTYFAKQEDRLCAPTEVAKAHGVFYTESEAAVDGSGCSWWLRSPADALYNALEVEYDGSEMFSNIHFNNTAVRPALWVDLNSLNK